MEPLIDEIKKLVEMPVNVSVWQVIVTLLLSFVLGLLVTACYIKTYKGRYYSPSFTHTLIIVSMVISIIILVVGTNVARAFSLAGALSIIRFRTAIRDPRDVAFIFMAMGVGLACVAQYYLPAIIFTVIICLLIFIMSYLNYGRKKGLQKLLKISIPENLNYEGIFDEVFKKYLEDYEFIGVKTAGMGTIFELTYSIRHKPESNDKMLMDEIRVINGNLGVSIVLDQQSMD